MKKPVTSAWKCLITSGTQEETEGKLPYAAKTEYGTWNVYTEKDNRYQLDVDEDTAKQTMLELYNRRK